MMAATLTLLAGSASAASVNFADLDKAVAEEVNLARTQPQAYAAMLRTYRAGFRGKLAPMAGGRTWLRTQEGTAAVDEAIAFLQARAPLPALAWSGLLAETAEDHARDQGPRGLLGHVGSDGSTLPARIGRYAVWTGVAAEDISYGYDVARETARQLIIDDGVPDRGHRTNIFNPRVRLIGVACGPHASYRVMCVLDFASSLKPR
jgi:uncharacterized protein YkwD